MTAATLETAPVVIVAVLAIWAFWDFLGIPVTTVNRLFIAALITGMAGLLLGLRFGIAAVRRGGLVLVTLSYLGAHTVALPLDPASGLAFLTLVLIAVELRILAERFAPILRANLDDEIHGRVEEALNHALIRIGAASALGFLGATLTADLALSGSLPLRSIGTALLLAAALILVVLLLAFWPLLERRLAARAFPEARIQTPK